MTLFDVEQVEFGGWENCYRLGNGRIELIVTADVGPRIIKLALRDGENVFKTYPDLLGKTGSDRWVNYGGHRLWHAPEDPVRTYAPDNTAVAVETHDDFVRFSAQPEAISGIQKEMDISVDAEEAKATVVHRLINHNLWPVQTATWALSVMREGGQGFLLHPPRIPHGDALTPTSALILWSYTNLRDPRFLFSERTTRLQQQPDSEAPQKIGIHTTEPWCGYHWESLLFLKKVVVQPEAAYPDMGSRMELFTDSTMLEVETLGPLQAIAPGASISFTETWMLLGDMPHTLTDAELVALLNGVSVGRSGNGEW